MAGESATSSQQLEAREAERGQCVVEAIHDSSTLDARNRPPFIRPAWRRCGGVKGGQAPGRGVHTGLELQRRLLHHGKSRRNNY
jgi:hypothetical protein